MWKALFYKWSANWKLLSAWNAIILTFIFMLKSRLFEFQDGQITLSLRTLVVVAIVLIGYLLMLIMISYIDYDTGRLRWMLLRRHQDSWLGADLLLVLIQFLVVYLMIRWSLYLGLRDSINSLHNQITDIQRTLLMEQAIESIQLLRMYINLNVISAGYLVCTTLFAGVYIHNTAISFVKTKQTVVDWIMRSTILVFLFIFVHPIVFMIGILILLGLQLVYASMLWTPYHME